MKRAAVVVLFASVLIAAGTIQGRSVSAQTTVNITMTDPAGGGEFDLVASATSAPEGQVTFQVSNNGGIAHDFVVIATDLPANQLPIDQSDNSVDLSQVDVVGQTPVLNGGESDTLSLTLGAGNYILLCNVPGHWSGMNVSFQVTGGTTPATPTTPSEGSPTDGTTGTGSTPSATTEVTGLGDTGGGQADGEPAAVWPAVALLLAGVATLSLGALGLRWSR
jgi:uncharacterized cupredoxin-like copper-binding protein